MNELVLVDTVDFSIFDSEGNFITESRHTIKGYLSLAKREFGLDNGTFNLELLKLLAKENGSPNESDFSKALNNNKVTIKLNKNTSDKSYKIIASGYLYSVESQEPSHNFNLIIHNAKVSRNHNLEFEMATAYTQSFIFNLDEDENGEYVDLTLEEIK